MLVVMFVTVRLFVLAQNRIRFIFVDAFLDFFQESRELIRVAVEHQFFLHKVDRNVAETLNFCNVSFKVACTVSAVNACDTHFVASAGKFFMLVVMFMAARTTFAVFVVMVFMTTTAFLTAFVVMFVATTAFFTVFMVVIMTATTFFTVIVVMIMTATAFFAVIVVMIVAATAFLTVFMVVIVTATALLTVFVVVYFRSFGFFF